MNWPVVEIFESINGEGPLAGQLSVFIRMKGCNLQCNYCDTSWANEALAPAVLMSPEDILTTIRQTSITNVTITGGEPLFQPHMDILFEKLAAQGNRVEVETNGSISLAPFADAPWRPAFTMDYKLPDSGMESHMSMENFPLLKEKDTVKFVSSSIKDMERGLEIMKQEHLIGRCHLYYSPVFGRIDPKDMVEFMKQHKLNQVNLQLQLHKYIWPPQMRGV